jgi:hypothetical protein
MAPFSLLLRLIQNPHTFNPKVGGASLVRDHLPFLIFDFMSLLSSHCTCQMIFAMIYAFATVR